MDDSDPIDILSSSLREAGIASFGFLSGARLRAAAASLDGAARSRCGLEDARGAVVAALGYGEGPTEPPAWARDCPGPLATIARFARANWYAELSARLQRAAALSRARLTEAGGDPGPAASWRRFVNSRLPEKRLALEAGLGEIGRHTLLMLPDRGSAAVLGLLLAPIDLPDSVPPALPGRVEEPPAGQRAPGISALCAGCGACVAACPTGALGGEGGFDRELCLQHWSSVPGELPSAVEAAWGDRLYGCDLCQEACPLFRPEPAARTERGLLGPGLPASWLEAAPESAIKAALRGSALGMGWISIEALKRNARHLTAASRMPTIREDGGNDGNL